MKIIALKEHDDGSATVTFDATQKEKELLIEVGLLTILKKTTKKFYPAPFGMTVYSYTPVVTGTNLYSPEGIKK